MTSPLQYGTGVLGNVIDVTAATPLPVTIAGGGATGPGTAATAQRVTYASDGATIPVAGVPFTVLGYQQLTLTAAAGGLALPSIPATATVAIAQNNGTQGGRFRYDGSVTPPTATTGQRIVSGGVATMDVGQITLTTTRVIADVGGVGGVLDIVYGRYGA